MLSEQNQRRIDRLVEVGYLPQLERMLMGMNVPFFWSGTKDGSHKILDNGTMCYVDTGVCKLGITANHVYHAYVSDMASLSDVEAQLGGSTIAIERHLIDRDEALDLATFRIPEVFVTATMTGTYHTGTAWPPRRAAKGEVIIHGGYPQVLRHRHSGHVDFGFRYFASAVNDATDLTITISPQADSYWAAHPGETLNDNFGGQSGGPVYRVIDANLAHGGDEAVDRLELVGFIYTKGFGNVYARHADFVNSDGTLRRF